MVWKRSLANLVIMLLALGCGHRIDQAVCTRVIDGDTIIVKMHGTTQRVRLAGIDCPETNQPFGIEAKTATEKEILNMPVRILWRSRDQYGRILGRVETQQGLELNLYLVASGNAWWYRDYSIRKELARAERHARAERAGLWISPTPTPPWEFRKRRSAP